MFAAGCYPQKAAAVEFTGKQFLEWSGESQTAYISNSITMTAIVATQGRKDISRCIDDWYPLDPELSKTRRDYILKTIREYPTYHPQAIILFVLQQECGSFKDPPPK